MSNLKSHAKLVDDLNAIVATRKTGTLFLRAEDGHAYAVAVQAGAIVAVWSGTTVGNAAVKMLCGIEQASSTFSPTVVTPQNSTPDAAYVLRLLGTVSNADAVSGSASSATGEEDLEYHERALKTVRANLLDFLGPFATHVLDDALRSWSEAAVTSDNLAQLLSLLAAEIDDEAKARKFVLRTISELGNNVAVRAQ